MDQIRQVDVQFAGYTEVLDNLLSGDAWLGMNYSGDVAMVMEGWVVMVAVVVVKEG